MFDGRDVLQASEREMRGLRGNQMAMIFQEPMVSLNPLHSVENSCMKCYRCTVACGVKRRALKFSAASIA